MTSVSALAHRYSPADGVREVAPLRLAYGEHEKATPYARIAAVRRTIAARADRKQVFGGNLFSDPAWDMLLELYVASLGQRRVQFSRLIERTGIPQTTVSRWVAVLENEGLVERSSDRLDSRLVLLSLSDAGRGAMDHYFEMLPIDTVVL